MLTSYWPVRIFILQSYCLRCYLT